MTDENGNLLGKEEFVKSEIVAAAKNRYANTFRKRWGRDRPPSHVRQVLVLHDQSYSGRNIDSLRRYFSGKGAQMADRILEANGGDYPPLDDLDIILVATFQKPRPEETAGLREHLHEALEWACVIGALGGAADWFVERGLCPAAGNTDSDAVAKADRCMIAGAPEDGEKLAEALLDRLEELRR